MNRSIFPLVLLLLFLGACTPSGPDKVVLKEKSFSSLKGWSSDSVEEVLPALRQTCALARQKSSWSKLHSHPYAGRGRDWKAACADLEGASPSGVRSALERNFKVYLVTNRGREKGRFTGYYEKVVMGSRTPTALYTMPLYREPSSASLKRLTRKEIEQGGLAGQGLELFYLDPVEAHMIHIEGSGIVQLSNGELHRVGYAAKNGHGFTGIGGVLKDKGIRPEGGYNQIAVENWLKSNPVQAQSLLWLNKSFVYFSLLDHQGAEGTLSFKLVPKRSLAIDRRYMPLGAPVYVDIASAAGRGPVRRLMVAQDVGGAIKGPVRGDLFWGNSPEAEFYASHMDEQGRYYLLLPKGIKVQNVK